MTLQSMSDVELQALADQTCLQFEGPEDATSVTYLGGQCVAVPKALLTMNGHELEEKWKKAHPSLRYFQGGSKGTLPQAVVRHVIGQLPEFCPTPLAEMLVTLSSAAD